MDTRLEQYIDMVRDISAESLPQEQMVPMIVEQAKSLFADGFELAAEQRTAEPTSHGRHLLYEDPCTGFVVIAMVWPAGADSRPHDHGTWGVVGVLDGTLEVTEYERADDGTTLVETGVIQARPGDVAFVMPPERDLHRMRNTSDELTVTVHTYGSAIEACNAFDLDTGESKLLRPKYTTVADSALATN